VAELAVTLTAIALVGGVQILMLGVVGDYLGRVYEEAKRRPLYFVDFLKNLEGPSTGPVLVDRDGSGVP
jgi:hypothetical protein